MLTRQGRQVSVHDHRSASLSVACEPTEDLPMLLCGTRHRHVREVEPFPYEPDGFVHRQRADEDPWVRRDEHEAKQCHQGEADLFFAAEHCFQPLACGSVVATG